MFLSFFSVKQAKQSSCMISSLAHAVHFNEEEVKDCKKKNQQAWKAKENKMRS